MRSSETPLRESSDRATKDPGRYSSDGDGFIARRQGLAKTSDSQRVSFREEDQRWNRPLMATATANLDAGKSNDVPQEISIRVIRSATEFSALREPWNALVQRSETASIFQRWEWIEAWLNAYGERELFILAGYHGSNLVGLVPLYVSHWPKPGTGALRVLRLLGDDPDDAGSLGPIADASLEGRFLKAAMQSLSDDRSRWDAIELNQLPES